MPLRCLVAEDHAFCREVMTTLLGSLGVSVAITQAEDGAEALRAFEHAWRCGTPYELVMMDVMMPRLDGLEATRSIRHVETSGGGSAGAPRAAIVATSANTSATHQKQCLDAGMDGFVTKPVNIEAIRQVVQPLIAARGAAGRTTALASAATGATAVLPAAPAALAESRAPIARHATPPSAEALASDAEPEALGQLAQPYPLSEMSSIVVGEVEEEPATKALRAPPSLGTPEKARVVDVRPMDHGGLSVRSRTSTDFGDVVGEPVAETSCMEGSASGSDGGRSSSSDGEPTRDDVHGRALRCLVADDNPFNREVSKTLLEALGHSVVAEATDGVEAVSAFEHTHASGQPIDIVLIDIQMPTMDGLEATRLIRSAEHAAGRRGSAELQRVAIIASTAHAAADEQQNSIESGMDAYTTKPLSLASLKAVLADLPRMPSRTAACDLRADRRTTTR